MSSLVDLVIATGIFFVFIALLISFVLTYYSNFAAILEDSELRTSAANVNNVLFGGKGVPEDWETRSTPPARLGLINDLYRIPVIVYVKNGSAMNNATMNFSVTFDPSCLNTTRENTIRLYNESNVEHPYTLYNKSFCPGGSFIRSADFAANVSIPGLPKKTFFVYFSPEPNTNATTYGTIAFPTNASNQTAIVYPIEKMKMVSPSKLRALRNLTYSQVVQTLGIGTKFKLEVDLP